MVEPERLSDALEALLLEPTDALRSSRADAVHHARRTHDTRTRMLLAEHYRALRAPDQAARWGLAEPGWPHASEMRALRLVLLERYSRWEARSYLDLDRDEPTPVGIDDLIETRPEPWQGRLLNIGCLAVVPAMLFGVFGFIGTDIWAVALLFTGQSVLDAIETVRTAAVATAVSVVVGVAGAVACDRFIEVADAALERATRISVEALHAKLQRDDERHALAHGWLEGSWSAEAQLPARRLLVESARRRRRAAEAGRWGAAVDGLTTGGEREAFARTLCGGDGWMHEFESRTMRRQRDLSDDERDVLRRAGIPLDPQR